MYISKHSTLCTQIRDYNYPYRGYFISPYLKSPSSEFYLRVRDQPLQPRYNWFICNNVL